MKKIAVFVVLVAAALFSGCFLVPPTVPNPIQESDPGSDEPAGLYILKAMDPLYISFLGIPRETQIETVIDEYGQITVPYLKEPIRAAGMSVSELEREIQRAYINGDIYKSVTINIQTSAKSYFMEGEVARPQEYPLNRRITLLQAIAAAGDYTEFADRKSVILTRRGRNIKVNAKEIAENPEMDIPLEAGDRIKVETSPW